MDRFATRVASRLTLRLLIMAGGAGAVVPPSLTAQPVGGIDLSVIHVQGQVYMLQTASAGGNIGVLPGPDGVLLVDDQVPALTESVVRAVRQISDEEIRFVVNTHIHIDHIGGNAALAERGAVVIAHDNVRLRMFGTSGFPAGVGERRLSRRKRGGPSSLSTKP